MKKLLFSAAFAFAASTLFFVACDKDDLSGTGNIEVELSNFAGDAPFAFGNWYKTEAGDSVQFSTFNYFLSNFVFIKSDGTEYAVPKDSSYFLVKQEEVASKTLEFSGIPAGDYKSVRFTVGVDSAKSVSDISQRAGTLDPTGAAAGMYWSWNSGYIFCKVEGLSPQAPLNAFTGENTVQYHTGLFGGKDSPTLNNLRTVTINATDELAKVRHDLDEGPAFHLFVDILEVFKTPTAFKVADHPTSHGDAFSETLVNNYADMFKLDHVHNH